MRRSVFLLLLSRGIAAAAKALRSGVEQQTIGPAVKLPVTPNSVRFAIIGDSGTGEHPQHEVAQQMVTFRKDFPFDFVLMLGDNIYGSKTAEDFRKKFEHPYEPLRIGGREVLRRAGQSRSYVGAAIQAVQHGWAALLRVQGRQRSFLRAG